jgi:hypothetical protein
MTTRLEYLASEEEVKKKLASSVCVLQGSDVTFAKWLSQKIHPSHGISQLRERCSAEYYVESKT